MRERLRERWRDKTRDNLTSTLNSLGVQAGMADRGRDEENVGKGMFTRSLGVVEVPEGPIRWTNVVKQDGGRHNRLAGGWSSACRTMSGTLPRTTCAR